MRLWRRITRKKIVLLSVPAPAVASAASGPAPVTRPEAPGRPEVASPPGRNPALYNNIPSVVTAVRLGSVPPLVLLVRDGLFFYGAALFLFLLLTDFLDGYLARRLGLASMSGAYFDAATDFILIFSTFVAFGASGFYAGWLLFVIAAAFTWFLLTSRLSGRIYDPVGKYYGSLLYGVIALRFVFSGPLFCSAVTAGVAAFAAASVLSRALLLWGANKKPG